MLQKISYVPVVGFAIPKEAMLFAVFSTTIGINPFPFFTSFYLRFHLLSPGCRKWLFRLGPSTFRTVGNAPFRNIP